MDFVIDRFIMYLDESILSFRKQLVMNVSKKKNVNQEDYLLIDKISERENMKRLISIPREEWVYHGEVFLQFNYLSEMLIDSPLNVRNQLHIVLLLLEKNLATNIIEIDGCCFDIRCIDKFKFKYLTKDEFLEFVRTDKYGKLKNKDSDELSESEQNILDEIDRYYEQFPLDIGLISQKHRLIKEHFFDKKNSFDENDLEILLQVLKDFGLSTSLIVSFRNVLQKEINKRARSREVIPYMGKVLEPVNINYKSNKVYNLIERELRPYFDIRTMTLVKPLNLEEQIYCVSLLLKLDFSEDEIVNILKIINKKQFIDDNPLTVFVSLFNKLKYYDENCEIKESIDLIIEFMREMVIVSDCEYIEWKSLVSDELSKVLKLIPKTYEYEIKMGRKLNQE